MRIFVTGAQGQLGHDVVEQARKRQHDVIESDMVTLAEAGYVRMDITDAKEVETVLEYFNPDAIIHCAAWTDVDKAEDHKEEVMLVNGTGTENIARVANKLGTKMMYISTDYVFDGSGVIPWSADCDFFAPKNVYGESKLAGEQAVNRFVDNSFIIRIAWVFGKYGKNFVQTMLKLSRKYESIKVVNDQFGTPTYAADLARLLLDIIVTDKYGYYNVTNEGDYISWYDFATEIFKQAKIDIEVIPVSTEAYGASKANRPRNSRMDRRKLLENGFEPLPDWKDALRRYLEEIQ